MTEYEQVLTQNTYNQRIDALADELILTLVTDGVDDLRDHICYDYINDCLETWPDQFENCTAASIAKHGDTPRFDPSTSIEFRNSADTIVNSIAYHVIHGDLERILDENRDRIETASHIQNFLNEIMAGNSFNTDQTASDILADLNHWYVETATDHDPIQYDTLNERHIRHLEVIDWRNDNLIDALADYLSDRYGSDFENYSPLD